MQILIHLLEFLTPYGTHACFLMFGILIACGFGLPLPEDVVLVTGGILASHGVVNFWTVNAICLAGVLIGDFTIFSLGRRFGPHIKEVGVFKRIFSPARDQKVRSVFDKYGDKVIFVARFMPGLRTPIFLSTGIFHVKPWKFLALDGLAALISVPLWIYVGDFFGANLETLEVKMKQFQFGIYFVLAALVVLFIVFALVKKRAMARIET